MPLVFIKCGSTGQTFSTGIHLDPIDFEVVNFKPNTIRCPHCGELHSLTKPEAFLGVIAPEEGQRARCEERQILEAVYADAARQNTTAVNDLAKLLGIVSEEEYGRMIVAAESTREAVNFARQLIQGHREEHGC